MTLFTAAELGQLIGKPVSTERHAVVERVVWGWLKPILGWDEQPDMIPPELFAWAIQLGAIAHENPMGLTAKAIGPFSEQYSEERRQAILDEIRNSSLPTGPAAGLGKPTGCFPPPLPEPNWL